VGKTVCVHAGLIKSHFTEHGGLEGMNKAAQEWIQQVQGDFDNYLTEDTFGKRWKGNMATRPTFFAHETHVDRNVR